MARILSREQAAGNSPARKIAANQITLAAQACMILRVHAELSRSINGLSHFEEFKPYAFRPLEEADLTSVRQNPLFEYLDTVSLDLRHLASEVVGIDGDVLE